MFQTHIRDRCVISTYPRQMSWQVFYIHLSQTGVLYPLIQDRYPHRCVTSINPRKVSRQVCHVQVSTQVCYIHISQTGVEVGKSWPGLSQRCPESSVMSTHSTRTLHTSVIWTRIPDRSSRQKFQIGVLRHNKKVSRCPRQVYFVQTTHTGVRGLQTYVTESSFKPLRRITL